LPGFVVAVLNAPDLAVLDLAVPELDVADLDVPDLDLLVLDLLILDVLVLATGARRPVLRFRTRFIMAPLT
jgi:hypothetical protein